jgi:hypothetical protein
MPLTSRPSIRRWPEQLLSRDFFFISDSVFVSPFRFSTPQEFS